MSSSMRNFMEAYAAVHNQEAREEAHSSRDAISEMNLSSLTDTDLLEIVEEVLEDIFDADYSVDEAYNIFADMFIQSEIAGRQQKIDRLCEALNKGFEKVESKAADVALEEFKKYRHGKQLKETWSDKLNQDKRIQKHHSAIVAQESLNVRNLLVQLFNEKKADKDYDGDGKVESGKDEYMGSRDKAIKKAMGNPAREEEKLRKDDDLFGSPNKKKKVSESMKQARKNVGASTCWDGYKAKGTKKKGGKVVPNCVREDQSPEVAPTGASRSKKKSYDPASDKGIDNSTGKKVGRVQAEGAGYNTYGGASPKMHATQMKDMAGASNSTGDRQKAKAATMRPAKNKIAAKSAMGESQGYNDRLDDSLGAKHGKKSQSKKDRRDESEGMEKSMGKRKYSGDKSMDKSEGVVWSQSEIDAINAKIDAWNEEGPAHPYETKAQAKAQKDHRQGKSSKGIKTGVNAPSYEASRTQGANRTN